MLLAWIHKAKRVRVRRLVDTCAGGFSVGNLPHRWASAPDIAFSSPIFTPKKWDHRGISEREGGRVIAGKYHAQRMVRTGAPAAVRPSVNGSIRVSTLQIGTKKTLL